MKSIFWCRPWFFHCNQEKTSRKRDAFSWQTDGKQCPRPVNKVKSQFLPCSLNIFFNYSDCFMQIAEFFFHFSPRRKAYSICYPVKTTATKSRRKRVKQLSKRILTWTWLFFDWNRNSLNVLRILKRPYSNLRLKYQEKIQRATCTEIFNWMCLRTLSDYCDVFNTTRARSCSRKLRWLPVPDIYFWQSFIHVAVTRFWRNLAFSNISSGNLFDLA